MADLYEVIRERVDAIVASAREKASDGLTLAEVWGLLEESVRALILLAETLAAVGGAEKKELALAAAERLYREVIQPIDLPWIPDAIIDPLIGAAIRPYLGWLIDRLVARFNAGGWPDA